MGKVARARVPGPLAPFADGFRAELDRLGYRLNSREYKVNQMSRLSRWLGGRGLGAADLDDGVAGAFLADFSMGRSRPLTLLALRPLLDWLRREGVIAGPAGPEHESADGLMGSYRAWMAVERGLAARTIGRYEETVDTDPSADLRVDMHLALTDDPAYAGDFASTLEGWLSYLTGWVLPRIFIVADGNPPPIAIFG